MSGPPRVSVVIPAYNAERFVAEAVASVLAQTVPVAELVVVDDGSTDATAAEARRAGAAHARILSGPNRGVSSARNRGLGEVSGEIVCFLDADDRWDPTKLERQLPRFDDPEVAAVGCYMRYESAAGRVLGVTGQPVGERERLRLQRAKFMPAPISGFAFRRTAVVAAGCFDELLDRVPGQVEDLELLSRVAWLGRIEMVEEVLGSYRIHGASASARAFAAQQRALRFIAARAAARARGEDLSYEAFLAADRPSLWARWSVMARGWYRGAGLAVAERRWGKALVLGTAAAAAHPLYVARRLRLQRGRDRLLER